MDKLRISGGKPLNGTIIISGAKNAALPLMAACLLTDKTLTLSNVPQLEDIRSMNTLLAQHGVSVTQPDPHSVALTAAHITNLEAPYDIVRKMRASILVLGPLLARYGSAKVSLPGGCVIGTRPVDLHLKGLEALGAQIALDQGYIIASAPNGLTGSTYIMPMVSVGATENLMMAACLAKGTTILKNAAREPEIVDLAACLTAMGAHIEGAGSDTLTIHGVASLHGAVHSVIPDRIETGTYMMAAAVTQGTVRLENTNLSLLPNVSDRLIQAGVSLIQDNNAILVSPKNGHLEGTDVMTEPFPGFATDLQAQMMAVMTQAHGASLITETIFENRFMHVPELARMGANITVHGSSALVRHTPKLRGAPVMATDIRASSSLIIAALVAQGETIIDRIYHLDRGYESLENKLNACGASVERLKEE